jgi:hypothetical protein
VTSDGAAVGLCGLARSSAPARAVPTPTPALAAAAAVVDSAVRTGRSASSVASAATCGSSGTSGSGVGRGRRSAVWISARPSSPAVKRSAAVGRPARSTTEASGPRSADTGISLSTRFMSVATVVSAAKGTWPVTDSTMTSASE